MKLPVTNNTAMPIYVHGHMIPAGETRHIDEEFVPPHLRPAPAEKPEPEAPADPLAELLGKSVKEISATFGELDTAQIEHLAEMELAKDKDARKSLLSAIDEELLRRAAAGTSEGAQV